MSIPPRRPLIIFSSPFPSPSQNTKLYIRTLSSIPVLRTLASLLLFVIVTDFLVALKILPFPFALWMTVPSLPVTLHMICSSRFVFVITQNFSL